MPRWQMVETELVRKKDTCERERTHRNWITIIALQQESSSESEAAVSRLNSFPTFLQCRHQCRHIFSGLQHLRPPCRRDSFDNFDKTLMKTRNNGLKCKEIKRPMYCFVGAGWEIFSRSFAAQAISLVFSWPFFWAVLGMCGYPHIAHKKPLPFKNWIDCCDWGRCQILFMHDVFLKEKF